jgi:hypothetical protein
VIRPLWVTSDSRLNVHHGRGADIRVNAFCGSFHPLLTFKRRHRPSSGDTVAPREAPCGWHGPSGEAGATEDRSGGCRARRARDPSAGWTRVTFVQDHLGRSRTVLRVLGAAFLRPPCWRLTCLRTVGRPCAGGFARNGTANERKCRPRRQCLTSDPMVVSGHSICIHLRFHS